RDNGPQPETMAYIPRQRPTSRDDGVHPETMAHIPRRRPTSRDDVPHPETTAHIPRRWPTSRDNGPHPETMAHIPRQRPTSRDDGVYPETTAHIRRRRRTSRDDGPHPETMAHIRRRWPTSRDDGPHPEKSPYIRRRRATSGEVAVHPETMAHIRRNRRSSRAARGIPGMRIGFRGLAICLPVEDSDAPIRLRRSSVAARAGRFSRRPDPRPRGAQARPHPADRRRCHGEDPQVHHGAGVQLAAHRLPAGVHDRAEPERGPGRRRRGAEDPAVHGGRAPVLPDARGGEPAGAGDLDRDERGGTRTDRGGGQLGGEPPAAEGERRPARAAGGPAAPPARQYL